MWFLTTDCSVKSHYTTPSLILHTLWIKGVLLFSKQEKIGLLMRGSISELNDILPWLTIPRHAATIHFVAYEFEFPCSLSNCSRISSARCPPFPAFCCCTSTICVFSTVPVLLVLWTSVVYLVIEESHNICLDLSPCLKVEVADGEFFNYHFGSP